MANLKKNDQVLITNYASPRKARILRRCHRAPRKWIVVFDGSGFIQTVKEENIEKV